MLYKLYKCQWKQWLELRNNEISEHKSNLNTNKYSNTGSLLSSKGTWWVDVWEKTTCKLEEAMWTYLRERCDVTCLSCLVSRWSQCCFVAAATGRRWKKCARRTRWRTRQQKQHSTPNDEKGRSKPSKWAMNVQVKWCATQVPFLCPLLQ